MTTTDADDTAEPNEAATAHWQATYARRGSTAVSWYRPHLDVALQRFDALQLPLDATILDAGAGASTWVDDLWERGYTNLVAVDLSQTSLDVARRRLEQRLEQRSSQGTEQHDMAIRWLATDICTAPLSAHSVDLWHDRAAFHFHVSDTDRARYRAALHHALRPGGYAIISTFADDGPTRCSGLPTARYDGPGIAATLGLRLISAKRHVHHTPAGGEQRFVTALLQRPPQ